MTGWRTAALRVIAGCVIAATIASFAGSYRGLYDWAAAHRFGLVWSYAFPLMADVFILAGELALFVALVDGWSRRARAWPWAVTLAGLAVSVAGNVGHVGAAPAADQVTAAVPPCAAFLALTVALGVLKRTVIRAPDTPACDCPPPPTTASEALTLARAELRRRGEHAGRDTLAARFELSPHRVRALLAEPGENGQGPREDVTA